jgi:hypothetical protein
MSNPIIIFRFHKYPAICLNRLKLLRYYNPNIPVYGIFGGDNEEDVAEYQQLFGDYCRHIYTIEHKTDKWKWSSIDFILRDWYSAVGKDIAFDRIYVVEWDLLLLDSIENLYRDMLPYEVGFTGLVALEKIENSWYWTCEEPAKSVWKQMLSFVRVFYNYDQSPYACVGPGITFPRSFLECYFRLNVSELCHEELRIPLFTQILGYPMKDTGFFKGWFNQEEKKYFNCDNMFITEEVVNEELEAPTGHRVFHPYRKLFPVPKK